MQGLEWYISNVLHICWNEYFKHVNIPPKNNGFNSGNELRPFIAEKTWFQENAIETAVHKI